MGTLNEKLEYLSQTKEYIKEAIISKGQPVSSSDTFRSYASKIAAIENGDVITATNTTGSAISADDRVWVNGEDVYTQNFTNVDGIINNDEKTLTISGTKQGIYHEQSPLTFPTNLEVVFKVKFTDVNTVNFSDVQLMTVYSDNSMTSNSTNGCKFVIDTNKYIKWDYYATGSTNISDVGFGSKKITDLLSNSWYYFKFILTNSNATSYYSTDGINWITGVTKDKGPNASYYSATGIKLGSPTSFTQTTSNIIFDLSECYVKVDSQTVWTPYTKTGTSYSIINDTDITSTSFTGVAQTSIANNASGSVKTILDGNGSYAPTLGTKVITRNNTYSASTDNLYGYSSVTVNVEDIPAVVESLSITPTTSAQSFTPTSGVDGYSPVTVSAVDSSIDANITAGNIKSGVEILGVEGTYAGEAPNLQSKIARQNGVVTADNGYDGLSSVDVGVGQIGETYIADNKTGSVLNQDNKVWLNYRQIAADTVYNGGIYIPGYAPVYFIAANESLLYNLSNSNTTTSISLDTFSPTGSTYLSYLPVTNGYSVTAYLENNTILQYNGNNNRYISDTDITTSPATVFNDGCYRDAYSFYTKAGTIILAGHYDYPVQQTFSWTYDDNTYATACAGDTYSYNIRVFVISNDGTTVTQIATGPSIGMSNAEASIGGITKDKQFLIAHSCNFGGSGTRSGLAVLAVNYINNSIALANTTVLPTSVQAAITNDCYTHFNGFSEILTVIPKAATNINQAIICKYNTNTKVFDDVTSELNLPSESITNCGYVAVTKDLKTVVYTTSNNTYKILQLKNAEGWVITNYSSINSDSLTGYAAENILAGSTGNVIVGTSIEPTLESLNVTPTTSSQTITPATGVDGYNEVLVSAVTAAIDPDITPENIVEGVNILGVTGTAEITTLDVTTSRLVVVNNGTDGVAYSDDGGDTWNESELPTTAYWCATAYGNGRYVAITEGANSTFGAYSDDGINWTPCQMPSGNYYDVCYGAGKFVAVNYGSPYFAVSTDGINWSNVELSVSANWRKIAFGNGNFFATGYSTKKYAYSTDGENWTIGDFPTNNSFSPITCGEGKFVAVSNRTSNHIIYYTEDFTNWIACTLPSLANGVNLYNIAYGGGVFLIAALGDATNGYTTLVSQDGITWTQTATTTSYLDPNGSVAYNIKSLCYDPSSEKFIALTRNGEYTFTAGVDGIWTVVENDPALTGTDWNGLCYGEPVTGTTTVDDMLNEINGENIDNYNELDDALDELNGESA